MSTFIKKKSGATAAEYGLISGAMGLIIIVAWARTYASISGVMEHIIQNLAG
jgi:Flp pilus assembly pilin Flp